MKRTPLFTLGMLVSALALTHANDAKDSIAPAVSTSENIPISQEFLIEGSYSGKSDMKQGSAKRGGVDDINTHVNYVLSPQITDSTLLRVGFDWERNSFGLYSSAALPNTLQSVNAIIGADFSVNDHILIRAELHPGLYGDFTEITGNDFDAPLQVGGTYLYSKTLQFIFGVQLDLKSTLPLVALPGIRWQFADKWVLSAIPPKPRIEYEASKSLKLYVGAQILGGTYHVNREFGSNHGDQALNNQNVDYAEFRVGAGFVWKLTPNISLDLSGGYVPYREFDFHSTEISFSHDDKTFHNNLSHGAPYSALSISGSF